MAELGNGMMEPSTLRSAKDLLATLGEIRRDYEFSSYDTESGRVILTLL